MTEGIDGKELINQSTNNLFFRKEMIWPDYVELVSFPYAPVPLHAA